MAIFWAVVGLILASLSLSARASNRASSAKSDRCVQALRDGEPKLASRDWWQTYLNSLPHSEEPLFLEAQFPATDLGEAPLQDARLYQLHKYVKLIGPPVRRSNPLPELESPGSQYEYIDTVPSFGTAEVGPRGAFVLVRSRARGTVFTAPAIIDRPDGVSADDFLSSLNSYLENIEKIVLENKRDANLDSFFASLDQQEIDSDKSLADRSIEEEVWRHSPVWPISVVDLKTRGEIQSVVTDHTDYGDTRRVATRETFKAGRVSVTILDTHLEREQTNLFNKPKPSPSEILNGQQQQRQWLHEVLSVVYPDYALRRHWGMSFIDTDYKEVLATANRTRYIIVRSEDERFWPPSG